MSSSHRWRYSGECTHSRRLHALGVSLHFDDLEWLNTQVLNPLWITNPIYALINHPEMAGQFGVVAHSQLPALLPHFPKDRLPKPSTTAYHPN